ncbi:hypothetical protein ONS95_002979 [Cadophora gregata]|uniref:uncharacterized protein n=1 Tax=Cadophora gregata TaxID=51156 RepID=UPI0026DABAC9|nr:uncharacterized protein ONS95_002979 [Cadophora gregata]KAK0108157.1 hypothetical protein ONS95_002979 [Cadophora gregata]
MRHCAKCCSSSDSHFAVAGKSGKTKLRGYTDSDDSFNDEEPSPSSDPMRSIKVTQNPSSK